ncbi:hypothetical protein ACPCIR_02130 [Mycobacterium sp. NPDC051198]
MSQLRSCTFDPRTRSASGEFALYTVQFLVGVLAVVLVLLGKPEFFGTEECIWFLGATVLTAVVVATVGVLSGYGEIGFAAATVTIVGVSLAAWLSAGYARFTVYFIPLIVAELVGAIILARCPGKLRQAGRGMLVGLLGVALSPAMMWIAVIAAMADVSH